MVEDFLVVLELTSNQLHKADLTKISERLRGLAREVSSLSKGQPNLETRIECIQKELKSIGGLLRGIE